MKFYFSLPLSPKMAYNRERIRGAKYVERKRKNCRGWVRLSTQLEYWPAGSPAFFFGKYFPGRIQDGLQKACGVSVLFSRLSRWRRFEGALTALARLLKPVLTEEALFYLSMIGSILIFCVGLNLVWGKKVRVANMLPALVLAGGGSFSAGRLVKKSNNACGIFWQRPEVPQAFSFALVFCGEKRAY